LSWRKNSRLAGKNSQLPVLNEVNAAFIEGGVSILASSRNGENIPAIGRAVGCRVSADRQNVTLLFPAPSAARLLEDLRISRQIAVVFGRPSTHQTIQLKGNDARIVRLQKHDVKIAERYFASIAADVAPLGFDDTHARAIVQYDPDDLTAVTFSPREAFEQTPGPRAGEPLLDRGNAHTR
jgi:hypothetical protein